MDINLSALQRLRAFKEQQQTAIKPFPLWALLYLYELAPYKEVYCNYMEGFKLLVRWLAPIEIPPLHECSNRMNRLHGSYDTQAIAAILNGYQTTLSVLSKLNQPFYEN
jgi:hypothetical protein